METPPENVYRFVPITNDPEVLRVIRESIEEYRRPPDDE